jgi:hypothetical protein
MGKKEKETEKKVRGKENKEIKESDIDHWGKVSNENVN